MSSFFLLVFIVAGAFISPADVRVIDDAVASYAIAGAFIHHALHSVLLMDTTECRLSVSLLQVLI